MRQLARFGLKVWQKEPLRWLCTVVFAAFLGIAAGRTVIGSFGSVSVVDGESMVPAYQPGARVYTAPIASPLGRGDIVLVDDKNRDLALKRIVGLPGETVRFWRGYVFVNYRMLEEPYLPKHTFTFPDERTEISVFHLAQDQYLVLGDNRATSSDSRYYGPVLLRQIKSRVPLPETTVRARCVPYTLPIEGKRTIRPID